LLALNATVLFEFLPKAVLAAVILMSCRRLFLNGWKEFRYLFKAQSLELVEYFVTLLLCMFFGLTTGIAAGCGCSLLLYVYRTSFARYGISVDVEDDTETSYSAPVLPPPGPGPTAAKRNHHHQQGQQALDPVEESTTTTGTNSYGTLPSNNMTNDLGTAHTSVQNDPASSDGLLDPLQNEGEGRLHYAGPYTHYSQPTANTLGKAHLQNRSEAVVRIKSGVYYANVGMVVELLKETVKINRPNVLVLSLKFTPFLDSTSVRGLLASLRELFQQPGEEPTSSPESATVPHVSFVVLSNVCHQARLDLRRYAQGEFQTETLNTLTILEGPWKRDPNAVDRDSLPLTSVHHPRDSLPIAGPTKGIVIRKTGSSRNPAIQPIRFTPKSVGASPVPAVVGRRRASEEPSGGPFAYQPVQSSLPART